MVINLHYYQFNRWRNIRNSRSKTICAVVTLSPQDNAKLFRQLKSRYHKKIPVKSKKTNTKLLFRLLSMDSILEGENIIFVLLFENNAGRTAQSGF